MPEFRRMYGCPHYFVAVVVANNTVYGAFVTDKLTGHPAIRHPESRIPPHHERDQG